MARDLVTGWARQARGRALWVVGEQMYQVVVARHPLERDLTYTNDTIDAAV